MKTILLIENDPAILRLGQEVLRDAGYAADAASDADEARTKLKATPYHGIVLDLAVPGDEGYGFASQIGGLGANRQTPLIIVGADEPNGRRRAFDAGAMAFLPKPFTTEALRAVIHSVISPAGPRLPSAPRPAIPLRSPGMSPAPAVVSPAPAAAPASRRASGDDGAIAVNFQGGPLYWCEPDPEGGWRCGRCELGIVAMAEPGSHCSVCHAEVMPATEGRRSGLAWLILFLALGLLLGWTVLQWWPSPP